MWRTYKNGNYVVKINDTDGTKIRICEEGEFKAEFPESIDLNITNKCDTNCQYCFVDANPDGKEAVIMDPTFRKNRRELDPYALAGSYEVYSYKPYEAQVCGYAPRWSSKWTQCVEIEDDLERIKEELEDYVADFIRNVFHGGVVNVVFEVSKEFKDLDNRLAVMCREYDLEFKLQNE